MMFRKSPKMGDFYIKKLIDIKNLFLIFIFKK